MKRSNKAKSTWWNRISRQEKNYIDEGLADIKAGRVKSHDEAKKLYANWL